MDNTSPALEGEASEWTGTYTWRVNNWTRLKKPKIFSPEFDIGGYSWRLIVFPRGNEARRSRNHISVYLDFPEASFTPAQMCPNVKFQIKAMMGDAIKREATHTFTTQKHYWGFTEFLPMEELQNPETGLLVNDTLTLLVNIYIQKRNEKGMRSKQKTGFVGIRSLKATSLLNPSLQCLFHIKAFRKAVFKLPTLESDDLEDSFPLAFQKLFYNLQYQNISAKIKYPLTVFDWDFGNKGLKHNALEIQRELFERLGQNDEAGRLKDCNSELFMGEYSKYIDDPSIEETQTYRQSFTEIPFDILECEDIYASLEKFCQVDTMKGVDYDQTTSDEKSEPKQYGLFDSFPAVLQFNLKRCYCNPDLSVFVKINSHYEFYDELDLDCNDGVLLSENADRTIENKYRLHSVVVHADGPKGGRYFAYIRHQEKWYKFDDEVVTVVSSEEAINGQFGDPHGTANANFSEGFKSINKSAAVRLVYIRRSEWERVMCNATRKHLPKQVRVSFEKERMAKEKRNKEKRNAQLFVNIRLAAEMHFIDQTGERDIFDLTDFDNVKHYRIHKRTPFESFKEMVCRDFGIPKQLQRFWQWSAQKNNNILRISGPPLEDTHHLKTVLDLRHFKEKNPPSGLDKIALMTVNIFLESPLVGHPRRGCILHTIQKHELMVFVKYYDPASETLSSLGHIFLKETSSFRSILKRSKKMAGFSPEDKVIGLKEDKNLPAAIWPDLLPEKTPKEYLMLHGDIIIIQKLGQNSQCRYPGVRSFLEYRQNAKTVKFKPLKNPTDEGFQLELMKTMTYEQVTDELAKHLQVDDPKKLRLTKHDILHHKPSYDHIEYNGMESLEEMLLFRGQPMCILYYEVLDFQLPYFMTHMHLIINLHDAKQRWRSRHELMLPEHKKVSDLVKALKVELGEEYNDCDLRVRRGFLSKKFEVLDPDRFLEQLEDTYGIFRVDVIPEDQRNLRSDEFLVLFFHCELDDDYVKAFRKPLWVKVKKGESVRDVKVRIQKTLEISDTDFSDWRIADHAHPMHPVEYLTDKDEILARFPNVVMSGRKNKKFIGDDVSFIALVH